MEIKNGLIVGESERDGIVLGRALLVGQNEISVYPPSGIDLVASGDFVDESIWSAEIDETPRPFSEEESLAIVRGLCLYLDGTFESVRASGIRKYSKKNELSISPKTAIEYLGSIARSAIVSRVD